MKLFSLKFKQLHLYFTNIFGAMNGCNLHNSNTLGNKSTRHLQSALPFERKHRPALTLPLQLRR